MKDTLFLAVPFWPAPQRQERSVSPDFPRAPSRSGRNMRAPTLEVILAKGSARR